MARKLRREQGLPLNEIAHRLGVAKSSVSIWVRDVELTPGQHEALHGADALHYHTLRIHEARRVTFRRRRIRWQIEGRVAAVGGDPLHCAGCMLFWAEGSKARNRAQIVNADPEVIRFFAAFLRRSFDVPDEKIRVSCNLFAYHLSKQREIEDFWLYVDSTRIAQHLYGAIQEYGGFERPEWLD